MRIKEILSEQVLLYLFLILVILNFNGCQNQNDEPYVTSLQSNYDVEYYDIFMEIDPYKNRFNSSQIITISPLERSKQIIFELHEDLDIIGIEVTELNGSQIPVQEWKFLQTITSDRGNEIEKFSRYEIQLNQEVSVGNSLKLHIEFAINPSKINSNGGNELLKFAVTNNGSRALHPISGFFPIFGNNVAAPFIFEVIYPSGNHPCIPGNSISKTEQGEYVSQVFESVKSRIPVFYIGPGQLIERNKENLSVNFHLADGQSFKEEIADETFDLIKLFNQTFGNPETNDYRIAFLPLANSSITGESKGNAIYFALRNQNDFSWNEEGELNFLNLISHEFFHNWNLWNTPWQGKYYEWFVEGGAGFISAWANEKTLGSYAGSIIRKDFVESFIKNKGYNASKTLKNAQKSTASERSLIYSYGALVWEQLRRKIGDEAFFTGLGEFFSNSGSKINDYNYLVSVLQKYTEISVKDFLNNWVSQNVKIDLSIAEVNTITTNNVYETTVILNSNSESNFEIYSSIGYKTSQMGEVTIIPIHLNSQGGKQITFASENEPIFIQLDYEYYIPQIDLSNDVWTS